MGTVKNTYDIIKDLVSMAKSIRNHEMMQLAMDLQERYFESREEKDNLLKTISNLNEHIRLLEESKVKESDIKYYHRGFLTLNTEANKLPYCSYCWKKEHKLYPLSQYGSWCEFHCSSCNTNIVVMTEDGDQINESEEE